MWHPQLCEEMEHICGDCPWCQSYCSCFHFSATLLMVPGLQSNKQVTIHFDCIFWPWKVTQYYIDFSSANLQRECPCQQREVYKIIIIQTLNILNQINQLCCQITSNVLCSISILLKTYHFRFLGHFLQVGMWYMAYDNIFKILCNKRHVTC